MRPFLFVIVLILTSQLKSPAQAYLRSLEEGKVWEIAWPQGLGTVVYQHYCLLGDTLLDGHIYFQVKRPEGQLLGFAREDTLEQKIFFREVPSSQEELLIDYQLQPGDSFTYAGFVLTVDSVGTAFLFGSNRKVLYFPFQQAFIEGIGHSFYGVLKDSQFKRVTAVRQGACDVDKDALSNAIQVLPNPFSSSLTLKLPSRFQEPAKATLLDASGKEHQSWQVKGTQTLNLQHLPTGVYFLEVAGAFFKLLKQ